MEKIKIKSLVSGTIIISNPELRVKRVWEKKGAIKTIDKDVLEQLVYDPSVDYLFRQGMLGFIGENAHQLNVELGFEEEGTKLVILTEDKLKEIAGMKMADFRKATQDLSHEQLEELVNYFIENEISDFDKVTLLKNLTQIDIISAIHLNRADKEDLKEE